MDKVRWLAYSGPSLEPSSIKRNRKLSPLKGRKIILAETEILKLLDYDVFWKGVDWVLRAVEESGDISSLMGRNTLDIFLCGPVLATGPDLWIRYGVEYIFTAVAGFLCIQIETLFQSLSLIPVKVSQAAQFVADSVEMEFRKVNSFHL
jgi:hypothetical protein